MVRLHEHTIASGWSTAGHRAAWRRQRSRCHNHGSDSIPQRALHRAAIRMRAIAADGCDSAISLWSWTPDWCSKRRNFCDLGWPAPRVSSAATASFPWNSKPISTLLSTIAICGYWRRYVIPRSPVWAMSWTGLSLQLGVWCKWVDVTQAELWKARETLLAWIIVHDCQMRELQLPEVLQVRPSLEVQALAALQLSNESCLP